jgi:transposase
LVKALARSRPTSHGDPTTVAVLMAAKSLAQRVEFLTHQERDRTAQLDVRVSELNPALRTAHGIGPDVAAQLLVTAGTNPHRLRNEAAFAALCGTAPVPASSGKTTRHRLSRGGDRAANSALHRIALVRMSNHPRTRGYVERQGTKGSRKISRAMAHFRSRRISFLVRLRIPRGGRATLHRRDGGVADHLGLSTCCQ